MNQRELEHQSAALHHTTPRAELTRDIIDGALFLAALSCPPRDICPVCGKPCQTAISTRDSYDDLFGYVEVETVVSACCGEEMEDGA